MAHRDLKKGTYTGQAGVMIVEGPGDPGAYDREEVIVLKEYEPFFRRNGPLDVEFRAFTINGRMAGAGEPIRVKVGERVLFRIVNASATLHHRLALPGHEFRVVALDGNAVPVPQSVPVLDIAPGERVDAIVEMTSAGVWWLGEVRSAQREARHGDRDRIRGPVRARRGGSRRGRSHGTTGFSARPRRSAAPVDTLTIVFKAKPDGHTWMINGKSYPNTDPIVVRDGRRYRWIFDNQSADDHPVHLHRHTFEVVRVGDRRMSGIMKDVLNVPAWKQAEVEVPAIHPGLSLFHCHQQFHMDMGFMAMMRYDS